MAKEIDSPLGGKRRHESQKARVNRHEKEIAEKLGGYAQPASGALDHRKGDVILEHFLLDSKETDGTTLRLDATDFTKITREANDINRIPGLVLKVLSHEFVAIPIDTFSEMVENGQLP
jgi:hypothetical protein